MIIPPDEENSGEKYDARGAARRRLSVREYSAAELVAYLERKGATAAEAEQVARELAEEGVLSDKRYARVMTRDQLMRGKGPRHILQKLRQKGVSVDLREVRALYEENSDEGELARVRQILERRYPKFRESREDAQRAYQGLLRRGFSGDLVQRCLREPPGEET